MKVTLKKKNCFLVFYSLVCLLTYILLAFRASVSGCHDFDWSSEKLGHYTWGSNPFFLRDKLRVEDSLPIVWCYVGFMAWTCLIFSYLFPCGYFLIHSMCRSCSTRSCISFKGISHVSWTFSTSVRKGAQESPMVSSWLTHNVSQLSLPIHLKEKEKHQIYKHLFFFNPGSYF